MVKILRKVETTCKYCGNVYIYKNIVWDKYKIKKEYHLMCPNCYHKKFRSVTKNR